MLDTVPAFDAYVVGGNHARSNRIAFVLEM
jgi:hypothetical protein